MKNKWNLENTYKNLLFFKSKFFSILFKIICVLLVYCMVTLWRVILCLDRISSHLKLHEKTHFITLEVARKNRSKYKITCQSVTKPYASNTHYFCTKCFKELLLTKYNSFYTCSQDFIYFSIFLELYIYIFYTWN